MLTLVGLGIIVLAITLMVVSAAGPRVCPATSARGAGDALRPCQPTAAVADTATSR